MKYINAKDILPEELVRELQRYAEGGYLYIPVEEAHQKRWGEVSGPAGAGAAQPPDRRGIPAGDPSGAPGRKILPVCTRCTENPVPQKTGRRTGILLTQTRKRGHRGRVSDIVRKIGPVPYGRQKNVSGSDSMERNRRRKIIRKINGSDTPIYRTAAQPSVSVPAGGDRTGKEQSMQPEKIYPRTGDRQTVYLKSVVTDPGIAAGDFTIYNDFVRDPRRFQENNVLYHYPVNHDRLVIGKFCSIACGAVFLFNSANHSMKSLSTYPFPIFYEEWDRSGADVTEAWDNKGDIVVGNDVWIGYEAVILAGVTIGDGAVIGARAVVTEDVPPYTVVVGVSAKILRRRFPEEISAALQKIKWWDWPEEKIRGNITAIQSGRIDLLR